MGNKITITHLANELGHGKEMQVPDGYKTKCPCHDDNGLSLLIRVTQNGKIRAVCEAGCKNRDIRKKLKDLALLPEHRPPKGGQKVDHVSKKTEGKVEGNLVSNYGITATELLDMEFQKLVIYLLPFLIARSITMLYADPGVGKSWLGHAIACGLTRLNPKGIKIGPWEINQGCSVLLVDGELPLPELNERIELLSQPMGEEHHVNTLTILSSLEVQEITGKPINITSERYRQDITEHFVNSPECRVLILDNLTSLADGMNENINKDWAQINRWLLTLRNMGVATILVHHANKSGKDSGHSSIRRNLNNIIALKRVDKDAVDKVHLKAVFEKGRDLKPGEGDDVVLELVEADAGGLSLVSSVEKP